MKSQHIIYSRSSQENEYYFIFCTNMIQTPNIGEFIFSNRERVIYIFIFWYRQARIERGLFKLLENKHPKYKFNLPCKIVYWNFKSHILPHKIQKLSIFRPNHDCCFNSKKDHLFNLKNLKLSKPNRYLPDESCERCETKS